VSAPDPRRYGDAWADSYDTWFAGLDDTAPAVAVLSELAGGATALEVGAGTGRLAIPLAATGVPVIAVEASPRMADRLRSKIGDLPVTLVVDDILGAAWPTLVPPDGLALAYLSCNTLYQIPSQHAQTDCLRALAHRLATGGQLVVEASVPSLQLLQTGGHTSMRVMGDGRVAISTVSADAATQTLHTDTVVLGHDRPQVLPVHERYVWPSELDLMAKLAGLSLADRFSGWERHPFTRAATGHISIYRSAACS